MAVNVLLEMERIMAEQNYVELRHVNKKLKIFRHPTTSILELERKADRAARTEWQRKDDDPSNACWIRTCGFGEIIIDGRVVNDVPASERGIGFVFQNYALFRYMTVYDNIAFDWM